MSMTDTRRHTRRPFPSMAFGLLAVVLMLATSTEAFQPGFRATTPTRLSKNQFASPCSVARLRLDASSNNDDNVDEANKLEKSSSSKSTKDESDEKSSASLPDDMPINGLPINGDHKAEDIIVVSSSTTTDNGKVTIWKRVKSYFSGGNKEDDGLTFRQRLGKAGLSMVLSYGWVSNMSYCVTVSAAWYIFSKQTKLSPLAPGQWKKFLAVYAGFYVFNNIIRPIRFAAAAVVSPQFDRLVTQVQTRLGISKSFAITLTVIAVNLFGTTALMCAMIAGAATLSGVPVFPPKVIL